MRALLASPLGFLIGLSLGALGGGGSILAVPVLVYVAGQSAQQATTTSLVLVGSAAAVGLAGHRRAGRVRWGIGAAFGAAGIGGSLAGTALNHRLDPNVLLLGFAGLVAVAVWRMLSHCPTCTRVGETIAIGAARDPAERTRDGGMDLGPVALILAAGTGVGFLTGLFGVGGGFVIVPALALALHLAMPEAIGTSLLVIAINSVVALVPRVLSTNAVPIDWAVTAPFAVSAMAGVTVGARIADRLDPRRSLRWFSALLGAVATYTAAQAVIGLLGR